MMTMPFAGVGESFSCDAISQYYRHVGSRLLAGCAGYALTLKRFPEGPQGDFYFLQQASQLPVAVQAHCSARMEDGIVCPDEATLQALVAAGCWEFYHSLRPVEASPAESTSAVPHPVWVGWQVSARSQDDGPRVAETARRLCTMLAACGYSRPWVTPNAHQGLDVRVALAQELPPHDAQLWADTLAMDLAAAMPGCRWAEALPPPPAHRRGTCAISTACNRSPIGLLVPWSLFDVGAGRAARPLDLSLLAQSPTHWQDATVIDPNNLASLDA